MNIRDVLMSKIVIAPEMIIWARERARMEQETLLKKFKKLPEWESGKAQPTLRQLEDFAKKVHVPMGLLFLPNPPEEKLPIPDFRTFKNHQIHSPSPDLIDTVHMCQERQAWYADFAQANNQTLCEFVGSANISMSPVLVAKEIRQALGFNSATREGLKNWAEALRLFAERVDDLGVLLMISGVVLNNPHRSLDPKEFRGLAISDPVAPLIFINAKDSKSAQMFTLAHELAHLWVDRSGLSNIDARPSRSAQKEEVWCNAVAAEVLVPLDDLRAQLQEESLDDAINRLSKYFKVSGLVILRRLLDADWLEKEEFEIAWHKEQSKLFHETRKEKAGGGNYHRTVIARVSRRFIAAVVSSTLEGKTLYKDAFHMLDVKKTETFNALGKEVGVR